MVGALSPRLPSSPRRSGGLVMPFFQTVRAKKIYRFSVNFLRFAWFFVKVVRREERGVLSGVRWAARCGKGDEEGDKVT